MFLIGYKPASACLRLRRVLVRSIAAIKIPAAGGGLCILNLIEIRFEGPFMNVFEGPKVREFSLNFCGSWENGIQ